MLSRASQPRSKRHANPLRFARTCYDHLAGELGVSIASALQERMRKMVCGQARHRDRRTTTGPSWHCLLDPSISANEDHQSCQPCSRVFKTVLRTSVSEGPTFGQLNDQAVDVLMRKIQLPDFQRTCVWDKDHIKRKSSRDGRIGDNGSSRQAELQRRVSCRRNCFVAT